MGGTATRRSPPAIREEDAFEGHLTSTVIGTTSRDRVSFVKAYEDGSEDFDEVLYAGRISEDGDEIEGEWRIPRDGSGWFMMVRQRGAVDEVERMTATEE